MAEIYVSTDIDSDGPIPGPHSMLSFASAAYKSDKTLVGTFEANLALLPEAQGDPKTMAWWQSQPEAWQACRENVREPAEVMVSSAHGTTAASRRGWVCLSRVESGQRADDDL